MELVINNLQKEKVPGQDSFTDKFYQTFMRPALPL